LLSLEAVAVEVVVSVFLLVVAVVLAAIARRYKVKQPVVEELLNFDSCQ
jgi:hypothetical protein